jgi:hypothetical protein
MAAASIDNITARNNTLVVLSIDGKAVGRIQQFRQDQNNNVQVLAELGREFMVEMQKGITSYSFSISKFLVHSDVMDTLKNGAVFALTIKDTGTIATAGNSEILESFARCMITSVSRDYTIGQAAIGVNASVVTIGKGVGVPTLG